MALGKLVEFDRRRREVRPRTTKQAPAEILIFTGVRYERNDAKEPDKPTTASARSKRKRG
jgi:hypothetical protein